MNLLRIKSSKLKLKDKKFFNGLSVITILLFVCSGALTVTNVLESLDYENSIIIPSNPFIGEIYEKTIAVGKGQTFIFNANSKFNTHLAIISGNNYNQWKENQKPEFTLYNQIGTYFNVKIHVSNYTILMIYWNNSVIKNTELRNDLDFTSSITGVDRDLEFITAFLLGLGVLIEVLNQIRYIFEKNRKKKETNIDKITNKFDFTNIQYLKIENRRITIKNSLHFLFNHELFILPKSIPFGAILLFFWIIDPPNKLFLSQPDSITLTTNLLLFWNSNYDKLLLIWIGFFLLIGGFYWKVRIEIKELENYFSLPLKRWQIALVSLILLTSSIIFIVLIPYSITIYINFIRFKLLPDFGLIFFHIAILFMYIVIFLLCGCICYLLFQQLPFYPIVVILFGTLAILYSLITILIPNFIWLIPSNNQTLSIMDYLYNSSTKILNIGISCILIILSVILLIFTYLIVISHFKMDSVPEFNLPKRFQKILNHRKLKGKLKNIRNVMNNISKIKISTFSLCLLVILGLSLGQIFIEFISPQQDYVFNSDTIDINNELRIVSFKVLTPGQSVKINISATQNISIKLIKIVFGSKTKSTNQSNYYSFNSTHHKFKIPPVSEYTIYNIYISNMNDETVIFSGKIGIEGFNIFYLIVPIISTITIIVWLVTKQIGKHLMNRDTNKTKIEDYNRSLSLPSFITRIQLLWWFRRESISNKQIVLVTTLLWITVQPLTKLTLIPLSISSNSLYYYSIFIPANKAIFDSVLYSLVVLMILLPIDSAELIALQRSNRSILTFFSLPIKRIEWILINFTRELLFFSSILFYLIVLKVIILNYQLKFLFPVSPIIFLLILVLITICTWISIGLYFSIQSTTTISTLIKTIISILSYSFITYMTVSATQGPILINCGGFLGLPDMSLIIWDFFGKPLLALEDITVEGLIVTTIPKMGYLFNSIIQSTISFIVLIMLVVYKLKNVEYI